MLRTTLMCFFFLTVQFCKSYAFADVAERSTGCAVNLLDVENSYFPMVLHKHLDKRAGDAFGQVNLKRDMMFFYCPNETNYLAGRNGIEKIAPILCWKGTLFNFDDARCKDPVRGTFEVYQDNCGFNYNGAVLFRIGFRLPMGDFITIMEACWDQNQLFTHFTRHQIQGSLIKRKLQSTPEILQDVQMTPNSLSSIFQEDDFDELFNLYMQSVLFLDNMVPPMVNFKSMPYLPNANSNSIGNNGHGNINVGGNSYGTYNNQNDNSGLNFATNSFRTRFNNNGIGNTGHGNMNIGGNANGEYTNQNDNSGLDFATNSFRTRLNKNDIDNTGLGNMNIGGNSYGTFNNQNDNSGFNFSTNSFRTGYNSNGIDNKGHGNVNVGGNAYGQYHNQNDNSGLNYSSNYDYVYNPARYYPVGKRLNNDENNRSFFGSTNKVQNTGKGNLNIGGTADGQFTNNNDNSNQNYDTVMGYRPQGYIPEPYMPLTYVPAGTMPVGAVPAGAIPVGAVPAGAIPVGHRPEHEFWSEWQDYYTGCFRSTDYAEFPLTFQQLSPKHDFAFTYERTATLRYINSAPMMSSIARGHLVHLEQEIRRSAAKSGDNLQMITGTHDVLELPKMGHLEKIYLGPNFKVPVPKYVWKMVIREKDNTGIVFVLKNSDDQKIPNDLCPGICGNAGVFNLPAAFVESSFLPGNIQCCTVEEFLKVDKEVPNVRTQGVLQLF